MMKTADWVKALRSGNYRQIQRRLSDGEGGFCCLGVLVALHQVMDKYGSSGPEWVTEQAWKIADYMEHKKR